MSDFREIFPPAEISATSREFLRTDPFGYLATRKRQAVGAVRTGDLDAMRDLALESLAVYGEQHALEIVFFWGDLIEEQIIESQ